jgi:heme exporter protein A
MITIQARGLHKSYGSSVALNSIDLNVAEGRILGLIGPNGAGKTTLLRVLATLLRPHAGEVRVLGHKLPDEAWAVRGRVGLLGHEPLLYRELTARENLRFHARLHGVGMDRVQELLEAVGMAKRTEEPVRTLSRGMVQRVATARALLHDPELLLLDEPRANLDPAGAQLVEPLIGAATNSARAGGPRTRVVCSHNPEADLESADLVLGLRVGRPALLTDPSGVDSRAIKELYG